MTNWSPPVPAGIGTSAFRAFCTSQNPRSTSDRQTAADPFPDLYCPEPVRIDEPLGERVNERVLWWATEIDFPPSVLKSLRAANFGRFAMLAHPDSDDVDRLFATAAWTAALTVLDDYYCDDEALGADPDRLGARLTLALAAIDHGQLVGDYQAKLDDAVATNPLLAALRSSVDELSRYGAPSQLGRALFENDHFFIGTTGEMSWRVTGEMPPVWQYLAARQVNSFLPCITTTDLVGGYLLPADLYFSPGVRRACKLLGLTTVVVNDLYSMAKENAQDSPDGGLPLVVSAERGCSLDEAAAISVGIHNDLMRAFDDQCHDLAAVPSAELQLFLAGIRNWAAGSREWHRSSIRFQPTE
jgi:2-methylisoborneol synthase